MATKRASRKRSSGANLEMIAKWLFLAGLVLSAVIGVLVTTMPEFAGLSVVITIWMLLAILTGYLFIRKQDEMHFFILAIVLFTFNANLNSLPYAGQVVGSVLNALSFYLGLAALSVAVRNIVGWFIPE
jgi:hypothetical protein